MIDPIYHTAMNYFGINIFGTKTFKLSHYVHSITKELITKPY